MCCLGPEGRNTGLFLASGGRSMERENLACPCCSFELHAMKTSVLMMKFRALFQFRDLAVYIRSHSLQNVDSFGGVSDVFFPILKFWNNHKLGVALENRCVDRFWSLESTIFCKIVCNATGP